MKIYNKIYILIIFYLSITSCYQQRLIYSINNENTQSLEKLLKKDIDYTDLNYKMHPTIKAIEMDNVQILDTLLEYGFELGTVNTVYPSAIEHALFNGHYNTSAYLIKNGTDLSKVKDFIEYLLHEENTQIINALIEREPYYDISYHKSEGRNNSIPFLLWLIYDNRIDSAKKLIEKYPGINEHDSYLNSVIHYASMYSNTEFINYCINEGYNPDELNKQKKTPAITAFLSRKPENVRLLLKKMNNPNVKNDYNENFLNFLVLSKNAFNYEILDDIILTAVKCGVDINNKSTSVDDYSPYGSPLQMAVQIIDLPLVKLLCKHGADPNERITIFTLHHKPSFTEEEERKLFEITLYLESISGI